jgi:hypothetical protein
MSMSASATIPVASPAPDPDRACPDAPPQDAFPRVGRLLGVVRRLVAFGTNLLNTLQTGASTQRQALTMLAFGTKDLALIIARIKCGLQRAAGLEVRLNLYVKRGRDLQPSPWRLSTPRARKDADAAAPQAAAPPPPPVRDEVLALLPSAEEIAVQVRTRPIGVVIGDICRDLGLPPGMMDGVLWRDLTDAFAVCGLSITRFVRDSMKQALGERRGQVDVPLSAWLALDEALAPAGQPP